MSEFEIDPSTGRPRTGAASPGSGRSQQPRGASPVILFWSWLAWLIGGAGLVILFTSFGDDVGELEAIQRMVAAFLLIQLSGIWVVAHYVQRIAWEARRARAREEG